MFVIDVPECALGEDAPDIGNLEKHDGAALRRSDPPDGADETLRLGDMLEGHAAADQIRRRLIRGFREILPPEGDARRSRLRPLRHETGVISDAGIPPHVAEQPEESTFSATDLDNILPEQVIAADQILCQPLLIGAVSSGENLRLLVQIGVDRRPALPGGIEYKGAGVAEGEID